MMQDFIEMSKYAGMREDLVQAGGGNSSYKAAPDHMFIKASGYQLSDITQEEGYAEVNPQVIAKAFLECDRLEEIDEGMGGEILSRSFIRGQRPSIETFLHAVSGKYTLHTHPVTVNILTARRNGMDTLKELFPEALCVPYATPGADLAKAYFQAYRDSGKTDCGLVFLQNHGLLVSAETAQEVADKTEEVAKTLEKSLKLDMEDYHNVTKLYGMIREGIVWRVTDENVLRAFEKDNRVWDYTFCPDCVVFLGKRPLYISGEGGMEEIERFRQEYGRPVIIVYRDKLYICAPSVRKALEIQSVLSFSAQVMSANRGRECAMLSDREQNFLLDWDAEKYRRNMK